MIRVGVGGWTFEPWEKGVFYPEGLSKAKQLGFNSSVFTANEVNGTYYSSFKPPTFQKWRDETPEGFVVAQLTEIAKADAASDKTGYDQARIAVSRSVSSDMETVFIDAVRQRAKPEFNQQAFDSVVQPQ